MILEERLSTFINSFDQGNTPFLEELEKECIRTDVPIIRKDMQNYLKMLLVEKSPECILEVGAAVGFSSVFMAEYGKGSVKEIITIENYEKRIPLAKENIKKAGYADVITLLEGNAEEILPTLMKPVDMVFMDAAKGQYMHFFPDVFRLLKKGGVLVCDNVLQDGDILESRFAVTRRNRTIHHRMREYLYFLTHHEELQTAILPVGDGITVSVRK